MDQQLNVIMATSKNFPNKIFLKKNFCCKKIDNKTSIKNYAKNLSKYRNYFKDFFVDTDQVTVKSTENYLNSIKKNKNKIMYLLYFKNKIIGQYGMHNWENGFISLDGALRISNEGNIDLFYIVEKKFLELLKKQSTVNLPVILCHKQNISAIKLHEKFNFKKIRNNNKLKFFENYIKSKKNNINNFYIKEHHFSK